MLQELGKKMKLRLQECDESVEPDGDALFAVGIEEALVINEAANCAYGP